MLAHSFFDGVAEETSNALERRAPRRGVAAGAAMVTHGDAPSEIFGVLSGRVKVWRASERGAALTMMVIGPGEVIGALAAARNRPHAVSASAQTEVATAVWPSSLVGELIARDPALSNAIMALLAGRAAHLIDRLDEMSAPVEQRVARTLCRMGAEMGDDGDDAGVELAISRADLADLTGTTVPTLSRLMSRWRELGVVDGGQRGRVRIVDLHALCAIGHTDR